MKQSYSAGQIVAKRGVYNLCDRNGVEYTGLQIKLKEGDVFPPTEKDGQYYYFAD